jgi:DNA-binding MarR family transcriptional regulator
MGKTLNFSRDDVTRVFDLVTEIARSRGVAPSDAIESLVELATPSDSARSRADAITTELVSRIHRIRMKRNGLVGAKLFRDPAWDMLLELFVAHQQSRTLCVSSLCYSSGVPLTTALRQLVRLEANELVVREGDAKDTRRCNVVPTPKALEAVAAIAAMLIDNFLAIHGNMTDKSSGF